MIPIKIEATNPGSIGAYKNTPHPNPIPPRVHDKPEKGSYMNWIERSLKESKTVLTEDSNLTEDELVEAAVSAIVQNPKYKCIAYWVDNEVDNGAALLSNNEELRNFIKTTLFSKAERLYRSDPTRSVDVNSLLKIWDSDLNKLNKALNIRYGEVS